MRTTTPALRRGLDILELFLDPAVDELRVPEIVERLGIPRASVHELVGSLVDRGYLVPHPRRPTYFVLGVRAFQLGSAYERNVDLVAEGNRAAAQVVSRCNETSQLAILDGADVVYVAKVDSTQSVRLVSDVGRRLPATCTAGGKVLLSALDADGLTGRLAGGDLPRMTPSSITDLEALHTALETTRARGWAEEYCESNENVACVAAPVRDRSGRTVAALSISVPTLRWSDERKLTLAQLVVESADELSNTLGMSTTSA